MTDDRLTGRWVRNFERLGDSLSQDAMDGVG